MSSAGQQLVAGRIPGERIATTRTTADSATFTTTTTAVMTVVAPLVTGRTYWVRAVYRWQSTVAGDNVTGAIREDSVTGTIIQTNVSNVQLTGSLISMQVMETQFTAVSTGNKTFILAGVRFTGSGTINLDASSPSPSFLYVDYIEG